MTARISRLVASGIGLGRESYAHHQAQKEESQQDISSGHKHELDQDSEDKYLWRLDDIQHDELDPPPAFENTKDGQQIVDKFFCLHAALPQQATGQLPCPVCIPERRPHHRTRGFIRAYAPDLESCGVDQNSFLDFLDGFEQAIKMHQAFNAVQPVIKGVDLAVQIGSGGNLMAHAASWVLHASVEAGRRAYVQYKTNEYLDQMNLRFFGPHGLYALIMAYRPNDNKYDVGDTINDAVANRVDEGSRFSRKSGTTKSELELPEACPLIFPDLDKIPDDKKPNVVKRAGAVASDYYDRRAQAQFDWDHPDSKLSVQDTQFASRYGDPNSKASSGGLVGLVSGGKVAGPRYYLKQRRRRSKLENGESVAPRNRLLTEDVLYLMIVNMPSEEEIEQAKQVIRKEQIL